LTRFALVSDLGFNPGQRIHSRGDLRGPRDSPAFTPTRFVRQKLDPGLDQNSESLPNTSATKCKGTLGRLSEADLFRIFHVAACWPDGKTRTLSPLMEKRKALWRVPDDHRCAGRSRSSLWRRRAQEGKQRTSTLMGIWEFYSSYPTRYAVVSTGPVRISLGRLRAELPGMTQWGFAASRAFYDHEGGRSYFTPFRTRAVLPGTV